jgi:hypothetical protein
MCADLSAQGQIGAVTWRRRLDEPLRRAGALMRVNVNLYPSALVMPSRRRLAEHFAVRTRRRSHAD